MTRTVPVVLLLAACAATAGCGGGSRPDGIGEPVAPASDTPRAGSDPDADLAEVPAGTDELRTAVRTYGDALLTGDGELAYALLSGECRSRVPRAEFLGLADRAAEVYGEPLRLSSYRERVDGTTAEVDYGFEGASELRQSGERWDRGADGWRLADC